MQCRYQPRSIQTKVRAILTPSGFVESTDVERSGPIGMILEQTPFYAGRRPPLHALCLQPERP